MAKVKAVALFDTVGYSDEDGNVAFAAKGEEFELDQKQFDRHAELGAVAKAGSKAAKAELSDAADEPQDPADEELTTPGGEPVDEPQRGNKKNG